MPGPKRAGRFEVAEIVRAHRAELESKHTLSREQKRVLTDIGNCRTAALGGHLDRCIDCGYERPSYNSCRNRHCPKCQALAQEKWIERQRERMLACRYFHVVFTMPKQLRPLGAFAPRVVYEALLHAASRTLIELADTRLKATIGVTTILHTWTRKLTFHPHAHALVSGGGLSHDGKTWRKARRKFLFPVKVMGLLLRGKIMDALRIAHRRGDFEGFEDFRDPEGFACLLRSVAALPWHVYAKTSFSNGEQVLQYLGRYTHRVGISNSRLLDVSARHITFRTKGDGAETITPVEFLRRLVQHVLPSGFHKIRHYGLHASADKRAQAAALIPLRRRVIKKKSSEPALSDFTVFYCPHCGATLIQEPLPLARAPPESIAA